MVSYIITSIRADGYQKMRDSTGICNITKRNWHLTVINVHVYFAEWV